MARVFHFIGVFFIFAASILLLITTISAPVIGDIALLKVTLANSSDIRHSSVTFGTFGHCVLDVAPAQTDQDYCYPKSVGYKPSDIMATIDGTGFSRAAADSANGLTGAMILHPIACGLAFIAFLISIPGGVILSLLASILTFITFAITLIAMAIDFTLFGIIKHHVNDDNSGSHAYFSTGMWTLVAAFVCLFFGFVLVLLTCCSHRRERRRATTSKTDYGTQTVHRRRFWQRSTY